MMRLLDNLVKFMNGGWSHIFIVVLTTVGILFGLYILCLLTNETGVNRRGYMTQRTNILTLSSFVIAIGASAVIGTLCVLSVFSQLGKDYIASEKAMERTVQRQIEGMLPEGASTVLAETPMDLEKNLVDPSKMARAVYKEYEGIEYDLVSNTSASKSNFELMK